MVLQGDTKKQDLTQGKIFSNLIRLAIPMMVGNVLMNIFNIVDMIFVGRLGPVPIAAVAISGLVVSFIWTFLIGIAMATNAMVSRSVGENKLSQAHKAAAQAINLGICLSIGLGLYGYYGADWTMRILGAEPEVIKSGHSYFQIVFTSSFMLILHIICSAILRGSGDAVTPMISVVVAAGMNLIFDPILIFGLLGFPRLEVTGAAIATVLGRFSGMTILLLYLIQGKARVKFIPQNFYPDFSMIGRLLKIGIPVTVEGGLRTIAQLIMMRFAATSGTMVVAAFGIGLRLNVFCMMPGWALGSANATMVGQNLGAKKPHRSVKSTWMAVKMYVGFMIGMGILFIVFAPHVIGLFNTTPEVVEIGQSFLRIIAFGYPFLALNLILTMAFGGAGDTMSPAVILAGTIFGIQLPLAIILPNVFALNTDGLWMAIALSMIFQGLFINYWFNRGNWKTKKI